MSTSLSRPRRALVALLLACALACGGLVSAPRSSASTPSLATATSIRNSIFNLLNAERKSVGRAPLHLNSRLIASAHGHNLRMAAYDLMSHLLPRELSLGGRIMRAGYLPWSIVGENIAFNTDWTLNGAYYLQKTMFNERYPNDGHRQNIINSRYQDVGIDVYMDPLHHKMWITEDFGHLR